MRPRDPTELLYNHGLTRESDVFAGNKTRAMATNAAIDSKANTRAFLGAEGLSAECCVRRSCVVVEAPCWGAESFAPFFSKPAFCSAQLRGLFVGWNMKMTGYGVLGSYVVGSFT